MECLDIIGISYHDTIFQRLSVQLVQTSLSLHITAWSTWERWYIGILHFFSSLVLFTNMHSIKY